MANTKISALTAATTPLAGTEVLPIVQSGATVKVSVANLTAGRAMAALSGSFGSSGTGANLNTKPNTYTFGTAIVPSFVMESNASGGTATLASSQGAVIWGTAASPTASINLVQSNPSASSRNYLSFSTTANGTYQETFRLADLGDVSVPMGNLSIGTSGKGVTTGSSIPLGLGTNGSTSQVTMDTSGNFLTGTTSNGGLSNVVVMAQVYNTTTASAANVHVDNSPAGLMRRSTSALKYKQDIRDLESIDIFKFRPVRYKSKCKGDDQTKDHLGLISDEVAEAGIEELVTRGSDGSIEGFQYERLTVVLLKAIQDLKTEFDAYKASHP